MSKDDIKVKLLNIQAALKVPKKQFNKFANFYYRNCDDILEALKPFLVEHNCTLTVSDDIYAAGNRVYIKATAKLECSSGFIEVYGYAREAETKKGMDESQITGMASSYARKYALSGMFLLDDTHDVDAKDNSSGGKTKPKIEKKTGPAVRPLTIEQITKAVESAPDVLALDELYKSDAVKAARLAAKKYADDGNPDLLNEIVGQFTKRKLILTAQGGKDAQ
jgi:hypothetical protein